MKKIGFVLALILTLAMLTAMTSPAFADASGAGFAEGSAAGSYDGSLFTAGGSVDSSAEVRGTGQLRVPHGRRQPACLQRRC